ncbi:hypothetical protein GMRT_12576 [Giardia muris]|uniref:Myb-like DNA-binding domain-containing protein n=1 Tax=Giardia muris TaxID=5742 RepID=A0A4Z1SRB4_GIAMU|nr:hypothetical protein GMRT_12576 [Giardia muris]|eukprot:TNJ28444.1 hypothetical protein GMRT_12576 [Giardia muris]
MEGGTCRSTRTRRTPEPVIFKPCTEVEVPGRGGPRRKWTPEEERILLRLLPLGPYDRRWCATYFPLRTERAVRARFYMLQRESYQRGRCNEGVSDPMDESSIITPSSMRTSGPRHATARLVEQFRPEHTANLRKANLYQNCCSSDGNALVSSDSSRVDDAETPDLLKEQGPLTDASPTLVLESERKAAIPTSIGLGSMPEHLSTTTGDTTQSAGSIFVPTWYSTPHMTPLEYIPPTLPPPYVPFTSAHGWSHGIPTTTTSSLPHPMVLPYLLQQTGYPLLTKHSEPAVPSGAGQLAGVGAPYYGLPQ